jgi:Peptidase family M41
MVTALLDDKIFKSAISIAKAFAKATDQPELTPALLLLGLVQLPSTKFDDATATSIKNASDKIDKLRSSIAPGITASKPISTKFPISDALRRLLAKKSVTDIPALVSNLLASELGEKDESDGKIAKLMAEDAFEKSLLYASHIARTYQVQTVDASVLVAGATAAQRNGHIQNRPGISAHLRSNAASIAALIAARGWVVEDVTTLVYDLPPLPLGADIIDAVKSADETADLFAVALNVGLNTAVELRMRERVAYHETGHAIVSLVLRPEVQIDEVSLIPKGDADGYVSYEESSPYFKRPTSRDDFLSSICVSLAGRGAEQKKFGHDALDAGASSDLESSTKLTWRAIAEWGLDHEFGPVNLAALASIDGAASNWLSDRAQQRLQTILKEAVEKTNKILFENWDNVELVATELLKRRRLSEEDLLRLLPDIADLSGG